MVPSATALRTLRGLPVASPKREKFIGFGDPFFNAKQAAETQKYEVAQAGEMTTRGLPLIRRAAPNRAASTAPSSDCCRACRTPPRN